MGANLSMDPHPSLPLSGGGKSKPLVRSSGLAARACRLLHLPLKGGGRREARGGVRRMKRRFDNRGQIFEISSVEGAKSSSAPTLRSTNPCSNAYWLRASISAVFSCTP